MDALIYKKDILAGRLSENSSGYVFVYDPEYLEKFSDPVSLSLPLQAAPYYFKEMPPCFDYLTSKGLAGRIQYKNLKEGMKSSFGKICAYGSALYGDLEFKSPLIQLQKKLLQVEDSNFLEHYVSKAPFSLPGKTLKIPLTKRKNLPDLSELRSAPFIGKIFPENEQESLFSEYLTMNVLSKLLGPDEVVIPGIHTNQKISAPILIIKRFDRKADKCIASETLYQILANAPHTPSEDPLHQSVEAFFIFQPLIPAERERLFRRFIAAYMIGIKNIGIEKIAFVETDFGAFRLAPLYGLKSPYCLSKNISKEDISLNASKDFEKLTPNTTSKLAETFMIPKDSHDLSLQELTQNIPKVIKFIEEDPHISQKTKLQFLRRFKEGNKL